MEELASPPADGSLALIGRTPMIRVRHLDTGPCELFLKVESANPGGSIKDRDLWMLDQGLPDQLLVGDLTDLVTHRFADRAVVTAGPGDPLLVALNRMKANDVSQLPVMEGGRIVGIVDESDLLVAALDDERRLAKPVRDVMATRLETVTPATPLRELLPMFAAGLVPIVMRGDAFVGLVTRMDVLGYLRRRASA